MMAADSIEKIYKKSTNNQICIEYGEITRRIVKIFTIFNLTCASLIMIFFLLSYFFTNNPIALPFILPGFDMHNKVHATITIILNLFHVIYCMVLVCAFDVLNMVLFFNTMMTASLINQKIVDLEEILKKKVCSPQEIKQFRKIIFKHREFNQ